MIGLLLRKVFSCSDVKKHIYFRLLSKKQDHGTDFLIFEAHARKQFLLLSSFLRTEEGLVNSTSPALYIPYIDGIYPGGVLLSNPHPSNISAIGQEQLNKYKI